MKIKLESLKLFRFAFLNFISYNIIYEREELSMKIEEIIKFKNEINKYSKEELEEELGKLHMKLTQMLMDSDLTTKIALIEAKIEEIKGE